AQERLVRGGTGQPVAVRSSATTEDAAEASFAGLQDTYLWIKDPAEIIQRVRSCWASLYSVESISYRRKLGFPEERVAMAVVVQSMVDARTAGVMFTRSPTTGDRSVVTIEWAVDRGSGAILLLQSRPETVWSARDAAPIAKREEDPLMHLMSIFGTRRCP